MPFSLKERKIQIYFKRYSQKEPYHLFDQTSFEHDEKFEKRG